MDIVTLTALCLVNLGPVGTEKADADRAKLYCSVASECTRQLTQDFTTIPTEPMVMYCAKKAIQIAFPEKKGRGA